MLYIYIYILQLYIRRNTHNKSTSYVENQQCSWDIFSKQSPRMVGMSQRSLMVVSKFIINIAALNSQKRDAGPV